MALKHQRSNQFSRTVKTRHHSLWKEAGSEETRGNKAKRSWSGKPNRDVPLSLESNLSCVSWPVKPWVIQTLPASLTSFHVLAPSLSFHSTYTDFYSLYTCQLIPILESLHLLFLLSGNLLYHIFAWPSPSNHSGFSSNVTSSWRPSLMTMLMFPSTHYHSQLITLSHYPVLMSTWH